MIYDDENLFYFCMATIVISSLAIAIKTHFNGSNRKVIEIELGILVCLMMLTFVNLLIAYDFCEE